MIVILEEQGRAAVCVCVCVWACVGGGDGGVIGGGDGDKKVKKSKQNCQNLLKIQKKCAKI